MTLTWTAEGLGRDEVLAEPALGAVIASVGRLTPWVRVEARARMTWVQVLGEPARLLVEFGGWPRAVPGRVRRNGADDAEHLMDAGVRPWVTSARGDELLSAREALLCATALLSGTALQGGFGVRPFYPTIHGTRQRGRSGQFGLERTRELDGRFRTWSADSRAESDSCAPVQRSRPKERPAG